MEYYATLNENAKSCLTCENASCEGACTYGLSIKDMLRESHEALSLNV